MRIKLTFLQAALGLLLWILSAQPVGAAGACTGARMNDWKACGCHQTPGGETVCKFCHTDEGMTRWSIDEPYINLHMADTPLSYKTSSGAEMAFTFNYKQRFMLPMTDQCPDLYFLGSTTAGRIDLGDPYMTWMRTYSMSNAAWMHNWMMDITFWDTSWEEKEDIGTTSTNLMFATNYEAIVISSSGGIDYFYSNSVSSSSINPDSQATLLSQSGGHPVVTTATHDANNIFWGDSTGGFKMIYADGSQDVFGFTFYPHGTFFSGPFADTTARALLTRRIDPQGRMSQVGYEFALFTNASRVVTGVFRVKYVVDPDSRTNTFIYNPTTLVNPWQVSEIDDPFGRKATFAYDSSSGRLTGITDAASNTSSFGYQTFQVTNLWINSLTTPYGTTTFTFDQQADTTATVANCFTERAAYVSEPDGAKQLFYYLHQATGAVTNNPITPSVPGDLTFDNGSGTNSTTVHYALTYRDSFHWDRRQFPALSSNVLNNIGSLSTALTNLTTADFQKARFKHWLLADTTDADIAELISLERDPSPDAQGLIQGAWTWYDYRNKFSGAEVAGDSEISTMAQVLSDGSTQYTRYQYNATLPPLPELVSATETTVTLTNGTVGEFTNSFTYGTNGIDLLTASNQIGQFTIFVFNTNHQIIRITNAVNETTAFSYDPGTHNLLGLGLPDGATNILTYYPTNSSSTPLSNNTALIQQIEMEPQGRFITITDYTNGLPHIVHVHGTGLQDLWLTNAWDGLNRLIGTTFQDNTAVSNIYTILSLTGHKDRIGNWTLYGYDSLEHLTSVTNALSAVTTLSWCGCGALTSITDPLTNTTSLNYDNQGRMTNVLFPDSSSLNYAYDLNGRITAVSDGSGKSVSLAYNNQGLVTNLSNLYGPMQQVVYDLVSRPLKTTDANNVTVTNGYDALNRLVSRVWTVDGHGESFGYATNGLVAYTNRNSQVTRFTRDQAGRLLAVTNANLQVTQFRYDADNHLTNLIDGLAHITTWNYNQFGWVTNKVDATNHEIFRFYYNADGQLTNRWMLGSGDTGYAYDAVGNLTNVIYSNTTTAAIHYFYDADNRITNMQDAVGTHSFAYTQTGQLSNETGPWTSDAVTYGYTQSHRTSVSLSQPSGGAWSQTYAYDSAWRITGLSSPAGAFGYGYPSSASALIQSLSLPDFAGISYQYDPLARLTNSSLANYWGQVLDGYGYGYDLLGQRTNVSRYLGITTNNIVAGYDNIGQLISWNASETNGTARLNEQLGYGYDAAGNLGLRTNNALVQTFGVDNLNQLSSVTRSGTLTLSGVTPAPAASVSVNGTTAQTYGDFTFAGASLTLTNGANAFTNVAENTYGLMVTNIVTNNLPTSTAFSYDSNGNLTGDGTRSFVYDAENRLTNVNVSGLWKTEFAYDGFGRKRLSRDYTWQSGAWSKTNETRYLYDKMLVMQERDSNNVVQVTYTRGLDLSQTLQSGGGVGGLLARTDTNTSTFYHSDGSGNVTALIDGNQNIVARYEYDPFGKLIGKWGTLADANVYRFSSKEYQRNSGLYAYGLRFYEPNFQRWVNRDPIAEAGGINLYRFAHNRSINSVDRFGLQEGEGEGGVSSRPVWDPLAKEQEEKDEELNRETSFPPGWQNVEPTLYPTDTEPLTPEELNAAVEKTTKDYFEKEFPPSDPNFKPLRIYDKPIPCLEVESPPASTVFDNAPSGFSNFQMGQATHEAFEDALNSLYDTKSEDWIMRTSPGENGVDGTYVGPTNPKIDFNNAELKPYSESGIDSFGDQLENWNLPENQTQLFFYNSDGIIGSSGFNF